MKTSRSIPIVAALLLAPAGLTAQGPAADAVAPEMTIAQLHYDGGGDWYANPSSLPNLLAAIRERTGLPVRERPVNVRLTDPALSAYPYLYITGHGNIRFTDEEVARLRDYLLHGGFLHVDDNFGLDESFRREIARVFPEKQLVELPPDHAVYHSVYDMPHGLPKIHEHDGGPARAFALFDQGRMILYYSFDSDLGDGWEDPDVHKDPPAVREQALRMGVNLFVYVLTQGGA